MNDLEITVYLFLQFDNYYDSQYSTNHSYFYSSIPQKSTVGHSCVTVTQQLEIKVVRYYGIQLNIMCTF